ncbi:MAG: hypothetical protein OXN17_11660 [Candidatus Poribacteria bacterium]|nr:hypothetical protein [Candidatus Poribacteria bacterium]MDE0505605.1 hypothetical protein [Candidatus Poribacteria bacterium]
MTKHGEVLLGFGIVVVVVAIAILVRSWQVSTGSGGDETLVPSGRPAAAADVSVSINAVPWANVFIKRPVDANFRVPPNIASNITPIRGGLKVPIGTAIRLVYEGKEKTFNYESWKSTERISHNFLNP